MSDTKLRTLTPAQYAFMKWLNDAHPALLHAAEERRASLSGFMDSLKNTFDEIVKQAPELLKTYADGKNQIAQIKLNIERAKQGQYPIESATFASAQTRAQGLPPWAWAAGGAILVYLLLRK